MEKRIAQAIYGSFKRLGNFPIDPSSYFEKRDHLESYLKNDPTAYPGQMLVVYNDNVNDNGLYIAFEGADKFLKPSRVSQSEELNEKISNLLETLDKFEKRISDQDADIKEKFETQDADIESRFELQNAIIQTIQKDYATKEEVDAQIETLLGFEIPDNMDDVLETFNEINIWVKEHEEKLQEYLIKIDETYDKLESLHTKDIESLGERASSLEKRVTSLEAGVINNVLQTITMEIDNDPGSDYKEYYSESISYPALIPSGYVIQSVRVVTADNTANPVDYDSFSVYLALNGYKYKELVEGFSYYPEIDGDDAEPVINVSFKNLNESYIFETNYEIPFIGTTSYGVEDSKDFELKVDIASSARCRGKLYINYFKKV